MAMLFFVIADYGLIYKLIVQLGPKLTIWSDFVHTIFAASS
jgi:hypothetical protein